MREANKQITGSVAAFWGEAKSLCCWPERCHYIAKFRGEVSQLRLDIEALEQYGRRTSLRISGSGEQFDDTTEGVLAVTNDTMELDPPLKSEDVDISHRPSKPRGAREEEPEVVKEGRGIHMRLEALILAPFDCVTSTSCLMCIPRPSQVLFPVLTSVTCLP